MKWPMPENWKSETMLKDLVPDEPLTLRLEGRRDFHTTPRLLMEVRGISGILCIDQIEWALSKNY